MGRCDDRGYPCAESVRGARLPGRHGRRDYRRGVVATLASRGASATVVFGTGADRHMMAPRAYPCATYPQQRYVPSQAMGFRAKWLAFIDLSLTEFHATAPITISRTDTFHSKI